MSISLRRPRPFSPYVAKGAEEFAKELGKDAAQKARDIYTYLKNKFSADSEESQILSLFEKKPEKYERNLTAVLQERAQNDSDFVDELQKHVDSAAPYIKVVQSLKGAKKAVGADLPAPTYTRKFSTNSVLNLGWVQRLSTRQPARRPDLIQNELNDVRCSIPANMQN